MAVNTQYQIRVSVVGDEALRRFQAQVASMGTTLRAVDRDVAQAGRALSTGFTGRGLQNASFQLQDFIVQVTGGTSAMRAFGQQAPQLLLGFGAAGAAIGVVAAALPAVVAGFKAIPDSATGAAGAIRDLGDALSTQLSARLNGAIANFQLFSTEAYDFIATNEAAQVSLIGLAAVIGVRLIPSLVRLGVALKTLALSNPFTAIALAAASAAAFIITNWESVKYFFETGFPGGLKLAQSAWYGFVAALQAAGATAAGAIGSVFQAMVNGIIRLFKGALDGIASSLIDIEDTFVGWPGGEVFANQVAKAQMAVSGLSSSLKEVDYSGFGAGMGEAAIKTAERAGQLRDESDALLDAWNAFVPSGRKASGAIEEVGDAAGGAAGGAGGGAAASVRELADALKTLKQAHEAVLGPAEKARHEAEEIARALELATKAGVDFSKHGIDVTKVKEQMTELRATLGETAQGIHDAIDTNIGGAFDALVNGSKRAREAMHDMLVGMLRDITKFLFQQQLTQFLKVAFAALPAGGFNPFAAAAPVAVPTIAPVMGVAGVSPLTAGPQPLGAVQGPSPLAGAPSYAGIVPLPSAAARDGGGGDLIVNISNNVPAVVTARQEVDPTGQRTLDIAINHRIQQAFQSGSMDTMMASAYGIRRRVR